MLKYKILIQLFVLSSKRRW